MPVTLAKVTFKLSRNLNPFEESSILNLTSDDGAAGFSFEGYGLKLGGERGFENEYNTSSPGEGSYPGDGSYPSYPGDGSYPEDDLSEDGSYTDMDPGRDHDPFSVPDLSELSKVGNNRDEEFQQKGDALYIDKDTDRIFVLKDDDPNNTPILLKDTWQGETFPAHLNNSYGDDERKVYAVEELTKMMTLTIC